LTWTVDALQVPSVLDMLNQQALPLAGVLTAHGTMSGPTDRPITSATVQGSGLVAYGEALGSLDTDLTLTDGELRIATLTLDKPQPGGNGRVTATGEYDIARKTYTLNLRSSNVRLVGLQLPSGDRVRGTMALEGRITGSLSSP